MSKMSFRGNFFTAQKKNFRKRKPVRRNKINFGDSFTLMVVPNSQKKILNFKFNILFVSFLFLILVFLVFSFFFLNTSLSVSTQELKSSNQNLEKTEANLSLVLDSVSKLGQAYESYKEKIKEISGNLDLDTNYDKDEVKDIYSDSDLASMTYLKDSDSEYLPQIQEINRFMNNLSKTIKPIKEMSEVIKSQKQVLADIPNLWPVAGSHHVSMEFGPNIHPVSKKAYIHKGIDISGPTGLPVLASANGKVIKVAYDFTDYGIQVMIEHKYGFKTRYGHMSAVNVEVGDIVRQGDVIGRLGSTGFTTGPHLHFEVIIGSQVVDPSAYLRMSTDFARSRY